MALLTLTPTQLTPGGGGPTNLTAALAASPLGANTGVVFQNDGKTIVFVQTNATGSTTVTSDIGVTIQGQAVPGVQVSEALSLIYMFGPYPSQYNRQDGTNNLEIDIGTPANVAGVVAIRVPGVV